MDGKGWDNCTIYGTVRLLVMVRALVPLIVMEFNEILLLLTMIQWQGTIDYHFSLKANVYAKRRKRHKRMQQICHSFIYLVSQTEMHQASRS